MDNLIVIASSTGFILLTIACYAALLRHLNKGLTAGNFSETKRAAIFNGAVITVIGWAVLVSVLALSGVLADFTPPPKLPILLTVTFIGVVLVAFSKTTKEILSTIPPQKIIRLQVFRVGVEILLWALFTQKLLPVQMTFEGGNLDILSGITAPLIAYYCFVKRSWPVSAAFVWNLLCLGLLTNIVATAILSMPTPFRVFMNEPANTIVTQFPYALLPTFLVPLAYGLHFFSLLQIRSIMKNDSRR